MHLKERRPADNLDRIGDLFNMRSERVDGNDANAMYYAAKIAVDKARAGKGPSIIEARTYRWRGHVDWREDDDVGLLRSDDLRLWKPAKCPIELIKRQMEAVGYKQSYFEQVEKKIKANVDSAISFALGSASPADSELLKFVFSNQGQRI